MITAEALREYARTFQHGEKVFPSEFIENALSYAGKAAPAGVSEDGNLREAFEQAHALIQEAKGIADGPKGGTVTDNLDFAEHWLDVAESIALASPSPDTPEIEQPYSVRELLAAMLLEHDAGGITLRTLGEVRAALASPSPDTPEIEGQGQ